MLEPKISKKLTFHARHGIKEAGEIALSYGSPTIEPKHLLLAIFLEKGSLGSVLMENMGFEHDALHDLCQSADSSKGRKRTNRKKATSLTFSSKLKIIITRAYSLASRFSYPYVGSEHLVYAIIESDDEAIRNLLEEMHFEKKEVDSFLRASLGGENVPHLSGMLNFPDISLAKKKSGKKHTSTPFLDQYAIDLTDEATKQPATLTTRVKEIERMIHILGRKTKNNPLLIGEPGVGKTTLVNALAKRILDNEAGATLAGKRILALDLALVVAGTNFRGEFEARLKEIIREASANPDIILFIDEIHTIIGAGNTSGGLDAANIFKPALSRGDLRCIGATTFSEYKKHIEKDPAFERRFQPVTVAEPSPAEAKDILRESRDAYERFHGVAITDEAIEAAVEFSTRYISDRFLPDKAFDLLDEAASALAHRRPARPLDQKLRQLRQEYETCSQLKDKHIAEERFDEAARAQEREQRLHAAIQDMEVRSRRTEPPKALTLEATAIARTVARITGIPEEKILSRRHEKLPQLNKGLNQRVIGQEQAIEHLSHTLLRSFAGIGSQHRPLGSFLFLGPSGVGKTMTAKVLADTLFEDASSLIRIDMSEFTERHSIAQMIGAPAGYVGYGEGGKLTEQIRRKPYSVVLFDEIEKAHPDVFNILLQILDEGWLTDAEGRKVSFHNTVIILTSNIGTHAFTHTARLGFQGETPAKAVEIEFENIKRDVVEELKHYLRPELLNRLDHIAVFKPLDRKAILAIVRSELQALKERLAKQSLTLRYDAQVIRFLAEQSFSVDQGARLVRRTLQDVFENRIAQEILAHPKISSLSFRIHQGQLDCVRK